MLFVKSISRIVLLIFVTAHSNAGEKDIGSYWSLEKDQKGVQVYVGNGDILTYRAEADVRVSLSELFNFFQNSHVITDWLYDLKSIEVIKPPQNKLKSESFDTYYYSIYSTPWPVSDVSAVFLATWQYDENKRLITNKTVSVESDSYKNDGFMHIPLIEIHSRFEQVDDSTVKLIIFVTVDHGYLLPDIIVDTASVDALYETLVNLKSVDYTKYSKENLLDQLTVPRILSD